MAKNDKRRLSQAQAGGEIAPVQVAEADDPICEEGKSEKSASAAAAVTPPKKQKVTFLQFLLILVCFPLHLICISQFIFALIAYYSGPVTRAALLAYGVYIFFSKAPARGGYEWSRRWGFRDFLRNAPINFWFARYVDGSIVKTAELEDRPYIFAHHPHGIIGVGTFVGIGTEAFGFSEKFPHQKEITLLGQGALFNLPLSRDIFLMFGTGSCDKQTIRYLIDKKRSLSLNIGGAREALIHPTKEEVPLILKSRKGFVKLAIENKVPIVPVYCFGEHDLYGQLFLPRIISTIQSKLQRILGFSMPLFYGVGMVPLPNKSLKLVFGAPISTDDFQGELTQEVIDKKHAEYLVALEELFENHKEGYHGKNTKLKFLD